MSEKTEISAVVKTFAGKLGCNEAAAKHIAEIEMALAVMERFSARLDPLKTYRLLCNYSVLGENAASDETALLQKAHIRLKIFSSRTAWYDAIEEYRKSVYDIIRFYEIVEKNGELLFQRNSGDIPEPNRLKKYFDEIKNYDVKQKSKITEAGEYKYRIPSEIGDDPERYVELTEKTTLKVPKRTVKPKRGELSVTMEELSNAAKEMREKYERDYCVEAFFPENIKKFHGGKLSCADKIDIYGVVNMVGMVGAGKSTLMKILSYCLANKGKKIVLICETVADAFDLCGYFKKLGLSSSPMIGKEREKYISQLSGKKSKLLDGAVSEYLCGACIIGGMTKGSDITIEYGKEPCYSLIKDGRRHTCPYYNVCPSTKMYRDVLTSSIITTTAAGLATIKFGTHKRLFLEYVIDNADLVIFDECDRVQHVLDELFVPETCFGEYVNRSAVTIFHAMKKPYSERRSDQNRNYLDELISRSDIIFNVLLTTLAEAAEVWKVINGKTFSSGSLVKLLRDEGLPENVAEMLEDSLHDPERSKYYPLFKEACLSNNDRYFSKLLKETLEKLGHIADVKILKKIKLVLVIAGFDNYLRELDAQQSLCLDSEASEQDELYDFLKSRYMAQQKLLPASLAGNLFGMRYDKENGVILYRQYACGRAIMTRMPWLRLGENGEPLGANALLLSGSSYAPGCYELHVGVPIKYVIETEAYKREFLEKTEISELGISDRVSGNQDEKKELSLKAVVSGCIGSIQGELSSGSGKILLIVNSYDQAKNAFGYLEEYLKPYGLDGNAAYLVRTSETRNNFTVSRSEIANFDSHRTKILVAPAGAVERGHNILDEKNHSSFGSLFFIVRPVSDFKSISKRISKLNGIIEEKFKNSRFDNEFEFCSELREKAVAEWGKLDKALFSRSIGALPENMKRDSTASIFITILQIYGRLARINDRGRKPPRIYFADGAFRASANGGYDCLSELTAYLDELMRDDENGCIAKALYEPFYSALRNGMRSIETVYDDGGSDEFSDDYESYQNYYE